MHILDDGFRTFFLGAAAVAALQVVAWVAFLSGNLALPESSSPVVWHGREMLFGFAAALVAGFLLTAVGNWTGRPVAGPIGIAFLFTVWLAGRTAPWLGIPPGLTTVVSAAFLPLLALTIAIPIITASNARNYPVVAIVAAFAVAGIVLAMMPSVTPLYAAVDVLTMLMALIGARIIPFFTGRRYPELGVRAGGAASMITLGSVAVALSLQWIAPDSWLTRLVQAIAGVALLACLASWRGWRVLREPMLWILHIGFGWLGIAMLVRALGAPGTLALHAITVGALGCLAIGVMTRVSLGHTGRALRAGPWMTAAFASVALAAPLRMAAPFLADDSTRQALAVAALLWSAGFTVYFIRFVPVMFRPRA